MKVKRVEGGGEGGGVGGDDDVVLGTTAFASVVSLLLSLCWFGWWFICWFRWVSLRRTSERVVIGVFVRGV